MRTVAIVLLILGIGWVRNASAEDIHLKIAPNPAASAVTLSVTDINTGSVKVEIFNVLGSRLQEENFQVTGHECALTLNVANLPEGIYLVRVTQNGNTVVKRLKVQHTE